jgi:glycosyltransferase involved in cell wall biosynthesis
MGWIVGRYARELVKYLPQFGIDAAINDPRRTDLEYLANVYFPPSRRPAVGLFAHDRFHLAPEFDGHIALNPHVADTLRSSGAANPVVIEQAVDECYVTKTKASTVFGVAGSVKRDNRKGQDLVERMVEEGYNIIAWGSGWPCPIFSDRIELLHEFYSQLDYYVVTSRLEGGCTPIIECFACGVPVISPKTGFAIRRPVMAYEAGDWDSLHSVLRFVTEHKTYESFASDHAAYFRAVLEGL